MHCFVCPIGFDILPKTVVSDASITFCFFLSISAELIEVVHASVAYMEVFCSTFYTSFKSVSIVDELQPPNMKTKSVDSSEEATLALVR